MAVGSGGLLVAGPLIGVLQGAVGGGAAGLLAGFVGGLGYWHDAADFPHHKLRDGAVLVGVMTQDPQRIEAARTALTTVGAPEVHIRPRSEAMQEVQSARPRHGVE